MNEWIWPAVNLSFFCFFLLLYFISFMDLIFIQYRFISTDKMSDYFSSIHFFIDRFSLFLSFHCFRFSFLSFFSFIFKNQLIILFYSNNSNIQQFLGKHSHNWDYLDLKKLLHFRHWLVINWSNEVK